MWCWNVLNMFDVCVFKTLWYACQELSTLGWGQRAFAGRWFAAQNLMIQTWNHTFSHWPFFSNRKFIVLNRLGVPQTSEQAWFGIKLAHSTRNCLHVIVCLFINFGVCWISCFKVCQVTFRDLVEEFSSKIDGDFDLTTMPNGWNAWDMLG